MILFLFKNAKRHKTAKHAQKSIYAAAIFLIAVSLFSVAPNAFAATKVVKEKTYPASSFSAKKMITSSQTIEIEEDSSAVFTIGFKNNGKAPWEKNGKQFVSVYTAGPAYRNSVFTDETWASPEQALALKNDVVNPGEIGYFEFNLKAPKKIGVYKENFQLAAEDTAFISGGKFTLNIKVKEKPALRTINIIQSAQQLSILTNQATDFRIGFKNTGKKDWNNRALVKSGVTIADTGYDLFVDPSWINSFTPVKIANEIISPGQIAFFNFKIKAPAQSGNYLLKMALQVDEQSVDGGNFELPITVTDEGMAPPTEPIFIPRMAEPKIRIGLFEAEPLEQIQADGTFELQDENGNVLMSFEPNELVSLYKWENGAHHLKTNFGKTYTSSNYFRFVPKTATYFLIPTYRNPVPWNRSENDNMVRGEIEFRYAPKLDRFYVINVLPLEDYLRGLAETSNNSPYEFQKAQSVAARTYALYYILNGGKHPNANYDLNTLQKDQVYRGYKSELRMSNYVRAAAETSGTVITYNNKIVITTYFGRSDGRTRDYTEVWGGMLRPWLLSRPCPYDVGRTKNGHGVGMSQTDAMGQANAGLGFEKILKLYYTGVEVKRVY